MHECRQNTKQQYMHCCVQPIYAMDSRSIIDRKNMQCVRLLFLISGSYAMSISTLALSAEFTNQDTTFTYNGRSVTSDEMTNVIMNAYDNILGVSRNPVKATGINIQVFNIIISPTYIPQMYTPFDATHAAHLSKYVTTSAQARSECVKYYPCHAVHTYKLKDAAASFLIAQYFSDVVSIGSMQSMFGNRSASDPEVNIMQWDGTGILDRITGHVCLDDSVHALWYYRTWAGMFVDNFYDVSSIEIANGGINDQDVLDVTDAIIEYHHTFGHLMRIWPNPDCAMTPVSLDPFKTTAPLKTVGPSNYRHLVSDLNVFARSPPGMTEQIHTSSVSHRGDDGTVILTDGFEFNIYNSLRFLTDHAYIPCGNGALEHSTTSISIDGTGFPRCVCNYNVINDIGCQFTDKTCYTNSSKLRCSGRDGARCIFDRSLISWNAVNPFWKREIIQCTCPAPYKQPTCEFSFCARGVRDCHNDRTGTCELSGDLWGCVCHLPNYGAICSIDDTFSKNCTISAAEIESKPDGMHDAQLLECSGRGHCNLDITQSSLLGCTCNPGWSGVHCEFRECLHTRDCGQYGVCLRTQLAGRALTQCQCAIHSETGVKIALNFDGKCLISGCSMGIPVLTIIQPAEEFHLPHVGYCSCLSAMIPVLALTVAAPPGLAIANMRLFIGNIGSMCTEPKCPMLVDTSGKSLNTICGVSQEALSGICLPCRDYPFYGVCAQTSGYGGSCDCSGFIYANTKGISPYWTRPGVSRFEYPADKSDPMCEPFCRNGGHWSYTPITKVGKCLCGFTMFNGDRCDVLKCPHGKWATTTLCEMDCDDGWAPPFVCNKCMEGRTGPMCNVCDTNGGANWKKTYGSVATSWVLRDMTTAKFIFGPTVGDPLSTLGNSFAASGARVRYTIDDAGLHTAVVGIFGIGEIDISDYVSVDGACIPCDVSKCNVQGTLFPLCTLFAAVCVCDVGYYGPRCESCSNNYMLSPFETNFFPNNKCVLCSYGLSCNPVTTAIALCNAGAPAICSCNDPSMMDPSNKCNCKNGYKLRGKLCIPCTEFWNCSSYGTASANCMLPASSKVSGCTCKPGYSQTTSCRTCAAKYYWNDKTRSCLLCDDKSCGKFGSAVCASGDIKCSCVNGYSGKFCDKCSGCGRGGNCSNTLGGNWCACNTGFSKSATDLTKLGAVKSPCSVCTTLGYLPSDGSCKTVASVCGNSALVVLSGNTGSCRCPVGFVDPPVGKCNTCVAGYYGPSCLACSPPCSVANGVCAWDLKRQVAACSCFGNHTGGRCEMCRDGFTGPTCSACPSAGCGAGGRCDWNGKKAICVCIATFAHTSAADDASPCSKCIGGGSPLTCNVCPRCPAGTRCAEDRPLRITCAPLDGYRRLFSAQMQSDMAYPLLIATTIETAANYSRVPLIPVVTDSLLVVEIVSGLLSIGIVSIMIVHCIRRRRLNH